MSTKKIKCLDLFCGSGGLSKGFEDAGFKTVYAVEFDKTYAKTFKSNFPNTEVFVGDIKNISNSDITKIKYKYSPEIIIGGPPCQGFSLAGNIGRQFLEDDRNRLFLEFLRFVKIIQPKMFVIENVAAMQTHNKGKTIKEIVLAIEKLGYKVQYRILNSVHFNVPQERRRIFIVANKENMNFEYPKGNDKIISIKEAIDDLPKLKSGETSNIPLHCAMSHSQQMLEKMSFVHDGGNRNQIPANLRPKSGDPRKYIRYDSKKPSFCVTGDMRKIFHYSQNRALTCRELARLQTFPDDFVFCGNSIQIQQQIGNAVPCNLAKELAKQCYRTLRNVKKLTKTKCHKYPTVNFIGNKEKIAPWIIENLPTKSGTVLDLFSGGCSVSYALKQNGFRVISNDAIYANYVIGKALIENNSFKFNKKLLKINVSDKKLKNTREKIKFLGNKIYFEKELDELAQLLSISQKISGNKKFMFLALLRRAMIRKIPYSRLNVKWEEIKKFRDEEYSYKKYGRYRHYHNVPFEKHILDNYQEYNDSIFSNGKKCIALNLDAYDCVRKISKKVDLIYLDPPYPSTMNNYQDFYGDIDKAFMNKTKIKINFVKKSTFLTNFINLIKLCSKKTKNIAISLNNNCIPSVNDLVNGIKKYVKNYQIITKHHVYKVTGKKQKQNNFEILLICEC